MIKNRSLPPELTGASRGMACGRVRLDEWRNVFKATIGLALLLGVASACSDKPEASSKALAIINGKEITASEFDLRWSQIPDYARKRSRDRSTRYKGGDLGFIKKGQTMPQIEKVLLTLKVGGISQPVATSFGYHLIKLVDRASGAPLSFEDAKDQVREELLNEKRRKRYEDFVASLRAKAKLRVADVPMAASEIPVTGPAAATP